MSTSGGNEVFKTAQAKFADALQTVDGNPNRIPTEKFLAVCSSVGGIFQALFMDMIAGQLKHDIDNSANSVKQCFLKDPVAHSTLQSMVADELKTRGRDVVRADRSSGTVGLLWAKRSIAFVVMYLDLLGTKPDFTPAQCAQTTYDTILAPYHGWLTSKFVSTVMGLAPERSHIYEKLGLGDDASDTIKEFMKVAKPVLAEVQGVLDAHEADFPDKV